MPAEEYQHLQRILGQMRGSISSNSEPQTKPPEKRHGSAVDFSIYP